MEEKVAISLFSGCGGLDLGLERAGFDIALASDNWKQALDTYRENFKRSNTIQKDASNFSVSELHNEIEQGGYKIDNIDLVTGGPPCKGFSRLNNKQIALDEMEKDDRNTLFHDFLRLATSVEPEYIVMENVRDLINREMSDGTYVKDAIVQQFNNAGYECEYRVLKAEEYGVPQKRRRLFFIGSKNKEIVWPNKNDHTVSSSQVLGGMSDFLANMDYTNSSQETIEKIKHIPPGGYYDDLPDRLKTKKYKCDCRNKEKCEHEKEIVDRYGTYLRRLHPDEPSLTVNSNTFIHPTEDRYLTPREMARLQTFPDVFVFTGNKTEVLEQIGNAVPPKLAEEIAFELYKRL